MHNTPPIAVDPTPGALRALRLLRIVLWAAFLLSLGIATTWRDTDFGAAAYATPVLLVLALIVTALEWRAKSRKRPKLLD